MCPPATSPHPLAAVGGERMGATGLASSFSGLAARTLKVQGVWSRRCAVARSRPVASSCVSWLGGVQAAIQRQHGQARNNIPGNTPGHSTPVFYYARRLAKVYCPHAPTDSFRPLIPNPSPPEYRREKGGRSINNIPGALHAGVLLRSAPDQVHCPPSSPGQSALPRASLPPSLPANFAAVVKHAGDQGWIEIFFCEQRPHASLPGVCRVFSVRTWRQPATSPHPLAAVGGERMGGTGPASSFSGLAARTLKVQGFWSKRCSSLAQGLWLRVAFLVWEIASCHRKTTRASPCHTRSGCTTTYRGHTTPGQHTGILGALHAGVLLRSALDQVHCPPSLARTAPPALPPEPRPQTLRK